MHPVLSQRHRRNLFFLIWPLLGAAVGMLPFWWVGGSLKDWWAVALWGETLALPALASTYLVRAAPVTSSPWRVIATIGLGAVITTGLWLELGHDWLGLVSRVARTPYAVFSTMAMPAAIGAALVFKIGRAHV